VVGPVGSSPRFTPCSTDCFSRRHSSRTDESGDNAPNPVVLLRKLLFLHRIVVSMACEKWAHSKHQEAPIPQLGLCGHPPATEIAMRGKRARTLLFGSHGSAFETQELGEGAACCPLTPWPFGGGRLAQGTLPFHGRGGPRYSCNGT
jgi:hypothetical protein